MPPRPDNVVCIKSPVLDTWRKTLCGKPATGDRLFTGLDHAFCHAKNVRKLQACSDCIDAALEGIERAREETEAKA